VPASVVDDVAVRAAGVLVEKGYWTWMFQAATENLTSWEDLHGDYWVVDTNNGCIWEWVRNRACCPIATPLRELNFGEA
jgi:hypothetical protein